MQLLALIVDNNPVLLKAISTIAAQEGCTVLTAADGLEALESMKKQVPDIVFTDLVMPLVDGAQLCKIIKNTPALSSVYTVVVSAVLFEEAQRVNEAIDCDLCIAKGSLKELRTHIRTALSLCRQKTALPGKVLGIHDHPQTPASIDPGVAREILLEKKHREDIVACLSEGVIELSHQGTIVEINQAALNILARKEEEVIGLPLAELGWGDFQDQINKWVQTELVGQGGRGLAITEEMPLMRQDRVLTATLQAVSGLTRFGICIIRDITRQHRAEEYRANLEKAIRLVKKMEAMSGMAGGVAHDFNNLLTVICGNIDMISLCFQKQEPEKIGQLLAQARQSAQAAVELVRKISHSSAYGIVSRELLDMNEVVRCAVERFELNGTTAIHLALADLGGRRVSIDQDQLTIALHNVLQNSMEAGGDGGITVGCSTVFFEQPLLEAGQYVPAGDYVKVWVRDGGCGIEAQNLVQIFDPYYSTKQRGSLKGMGLGLTVVFATIRNHGGYVMVESTPGSGTTLSFYLPLFESAVVQGSAAQSSAGKDRLSILLVDEDEQSRQVSSIMLDYLGYEVIAAAERAEAVARFRQELEAERPFCAALVSLTADNALAGVRLCRELHDISPQLQIIAASGALTEPIMEQCRSYGFYNTLAKPFTVDDVKNILSNL